jgi:hypothetical protein
VQQPPSWQKLPYDVVGVIVTCLPHQHRSRYTVVCRSFRDHHASALRLERSALSRHISTVGEARAKVFTLRILRMVWKVQNPKGATVWGFDHSLGSDKVCAYLHDTHAPAGEVVYGDKDEKHFKISLTRTNVGGFWDRGVWRHRLETWSLHLGSVSVEAVAVALDLVRELQSSHDLRKLAFTKVTVAMTYGEGPQNAQAKATLYASLILLLHDLRIRVSDEHLGRLLAAEWSMWSTDEGCCTYPTGWVPQ